MKQIISDANPCADNFNIRGSAPMYSQIASMMRGYVQRGEWESGALIPSLSELSEALPVSKITIRQALDMLEVEGLIKRVRGKGTFVLEPKEEHPLYRIGTDWIELTNRTSSLEIEEVSFDASVTPPTIYHQDGKANGEYSHLLRRLKFRDEIYAIGETYLLKDVYDKIGHEKFQKPMPLSLLHEELGSRIGKASQTIRAGIADFALSRMLEINVGSAVIFVYRTLFNIDNELVYQSLGKFRGDRVEIHQNLHS